MSDEKKKDPHFPETFFLPPLKMLLSFPDKELPEQEKKNKDDPKQEKIVGKNVEKLIEKLREKEKKE